MKKVVIQMEKQKRLYEEKALEALQRATEEKMEALSMAETLQVRYGVFKYYNHDISFGHINADGIFLFI